MTNPVPEDNPENLSEVAPADSAAIPTEIGSVERRSYASEILALHIQGRKGANWFYWVAGLSLVNSAIILGGGGIFFVIGLGLTLVTDGLAAAISQHHPEAVWMVKGAALVFDVFVAAILAGFGWLSGRRYLAIFGVGMALYLLDGFIFSCSKIGCPSPSMGMLCSGCGVVFKRSGNSAYWKLRF